MSVRSKENLGNLGNLGSIIWYYVTHIYWVFFIASICLRLSLNFHCYLNHSCEYRHKQLLKRVDKVSCLYICEQGLSYIFLLFTFLFSFHFLFYLIFALIYVIWMFKYNCFQSLELDIFGTWITLEGSKK